MLQLTLCISANAAIFLVINQGSRLAEMPMRGVGRPHNIRVALQELAEVSPLLQD